MIAITNDQGDLIRWLSGSGTYGWHQTLGFISEASLEERSRMRKEAGLRTDANAWHCRFQVQGQPGAWKFAALNGAAFEQVAPDHFALNAGSQKFHLRLNAEGIRTE